MKFSTRFFGVLTLAFSVFTSSVFAQYQVPNAGFEQTAGNYEGVLQPATWHLSNVEQAGFSFAIGEVSTDAHTGSYSVLCQDKSVGAFGITEVSPSWVTYGTPWAYLEGLSTGTATAGTYGGIAWTARPDTMGVWLKRVTSNNNEDMNLVYYSWTGTATNNKYKNKNGGCTEHSVTDEESDICQSDMNECQSPSGNAVQVAQGWLRTRANYNSWTFVKVPISYFNESVPQKMNIILSASNYPNKRANSGLYTTSKLWVDDVTMIYSSRIHQIRINERPMSGFQVDKYNYTYELGENATDNDVRNLSVAAYRSGRRLSGSEITMTSVSHLDETMTITVRAEDGSSTSTYRVTFVKKQSVNCRPNAIAVDGTVIPGFNAYETDYTVEVPYGSTEMPAITVTPGHPKQTYTIVPTSIPGTAVVTVYAENTSVSASYNIHLVQAKLSDTTLEGIYVNGHLIPGYKSTKTVYGNVEVPIGSTSVDITYTSAYPAGEQTVVVDNQGVNATSTLTVTAPGATSARTYKITCNEAESSYANLADLLLDGVSVEGFDPEVYSYSVNLPVGTAALPAITWEQGDEYQTVVKDESGVTGTDGTVRITVKAGNGKNTQTYRITFATVKSSVCSLNDIQLNGVSIAGFDPEVTSYTQNIAAGAPLPTVTYEQGDAFQTVVVTSTATRIRLIVTAQDGTSKTYTIEFTTTVSDVTTLNDLLVDGVSLPGFDANQYSYDIELPRGTTVLPAITWVLGDASQTVRLVKGGVNGQTSVIVRSQAGSTATYLLNFSVPVSSDTRLTDIRVGGATLEGFDPDVTDYAYVLSSGTTTLPEIEYVKGDDFQNVKVVTAGVKGTTTLTVTAEDGSKRIYNIAFSVEKSVNAALLGIFLDGVLIPGFDPYVLDYRYALSASDLTCPAVSVSKTEGQTVSIIVPARLGTARITVTPEEGASNVYTVTFTEQLSDNSRLSDLQVAGVTVPGFDPETLTYDYVLPQGTVALPSIAFTKGDDKQQVQVVSNGLDAPTTLTVVAESGDQTVYTLNFLVEHSSTAALSDLLLDGVSVPGFDPAVFDYAVTLPKSAVQCPTVDYVKGDAGQVVDMTQPFLQGTATVHVVSEDGSAESTYRIVFTQAVDDALYLTDLQVNGATVDGFDPMQLTYNVSLPYGSGVPSVDYAVAGSQTVTVANDRDGCDITVTSETGETVVYTLAYHYAVSTQSALADLQLYDEASESYVSLAGFQPEQLDYQQTLAWRTARVPAVNPVFMDDAQSAVIAYSGVNGTTTVTVTAGDGVSQTVYTIQFAVEKSSDASLSAILVGDEEISVEAGVTSYTYQLPYGTQQLPVLSYVKGYADDGSLLAEQKVQMTVAPIDGTSVFTVTAEDGTEQTYELNFTVESAHKPNTLRYIYCGIYSVAVTEGVQDYTITLPYGTTVMPEVTYLKQYPEQTVEVVQGFLGQASTLRVHANEPGVADTEYTLTVNVSNQSPCALTGISGAASLYPAFDPDVTDYVAFVNAPEDIAFQIDEGLSTMDVDRNGAVCTAVVTALSDDMLERTYHVYLHYENDVIPNGEFTNWTKAANNNADKPTNWTVPADVANSFSVWPFTYSTGKEVQKDNGAVKLSTRVSGKALGGYFPGMTTLGSMAVSFGEANGSTSSVDGGIDFRNTPDFFSIRYSYPKKSDSKVTNLHFRCTLTDGSSTVAADYTDNQTSSNYKVANVPLNYGAVFAPTSMNIILNSSQTENASAMSDLGGSIGGWFSSGANDEVAYAMVDYVRFVYSSSLTGVTVNGAAAEKTGDNTFAASLASEFSGYPVLGFTGAVSDQSRQVIWGEETAGVRTATIRSYAEDANYTDYTLTLTRPLSAVNTLADLRVDGTSIAGFDPNNDNYSVSLPNGTRILPDVQALKGSAHQTVTVAYGEYAATVTVTAENGDVRTYALTFVEEKSSDATLQSVTVEGYDLGFDAAVDNYTLTLAPQTTLLPAITFEKKSDGQTVTLTEGGVSGVTVLSVTAEDGVTTAEYRIQSEVAPYTESEAVLAGLSVVDGNDLNYQPATYDYTHNRLSGQLLYGAYAGLCADDQMTAEVNANQLTVRVSNVLSAADHTYTLVFTQTPSTNTLLSDLVLNDASIEGFNANLGEYEVALPTGTPIRLQPVLGEDGQTVAIAYDEATAVYTITVTAADGVSTGVYTVAILDALSSNADLADILLDGVSLAGFNADQLTYTVVLPSAQPKMVDPTLPDLNALGADRAQTLAIERAGLNQTSFITVTAEDGVTEKVYEITFLPELSSNAYLDDLAADFVTVSGFDPATFDYELAVAGNYRPQITWQKGDAFQTVDDDVTESLVTLTVTAEDGTVNTYRITLTATYSDNADITGILVGGEPLAGFDPARTDYDILLPFGTEVLPDITIVSGADGQTVEITNEGLRGTSTIVITAEDGVTNNTYAIHFSVEASNIAWLQSISSDGNWSSDYDPMNLDYQIELPIGTKSLPEVTFVKGDLLQTVDSTWNGNVLTLHVTAENGVDDMTYTLSYTFLKSDNAYLHSIYLNGSDLPGFVETNFAYSVDIPVGTKTLPTVEWAEGDAYQTIDSVWNGNQVSITVMADDQIHTNTYVIDFTFLLSENALLQEITVGGNLLNGFDPNKFDYSYQLPIGTTELPAVAWEAGDEFQTITYEENGVEGVYSIQVVAEDTNFSNTYQIAFTVEKSHNANLASVTVNEVFSVELFEDQDDYVVNLPYGTTTAVLSYEQAEETQTVTLTQADDIDGTATILVVAQDGTTQRTYTFQFSVEPSHEARLQNIFYDGIAVDGFDPDNGMYDIALPFGTASEPQVTWEAMLDAFGHPAPYQSVTATPLTSTNDEQGVLQTCGYEIVVVAQDGDETFEYVLNFTVEKSPENHLVDLTVFGQTIEGFHPDTLYYQLQYPPYTDPATLPHRAEDFGWQLKDTDYSTAVLDIKTDEEGNLMGIYNIKVTAGNGSVLTYTVQTEILLSDNTKLDDILINGKSLPNFDPDQREYIYIVPFGTVVLDTTATGYLIDWKLQEDAQIVVREENTLVGLTYTIWVTAQDGSFDSYVIQFLPDDYDPTQVPTEEHVCVTSMPDGSWRFTTDTRNIMLYLADLSGHVMEIQPLDIVDPNCETICSPDANGYVFRGPEEQILVYYFVYDLKKVVASGKFRTRR